jgi:hypothetical protein
MKKLTNYLIFFFIIAIIPACSSLADPPYEVTNDNNTLIGHYIYGHEVNTFQPCGNNRVFWVNGTSEVLGLLEVNYHKHTSKPYEEVFVKISGTFSAKANDGFAADYDGVFQIEELHLMRKLSQSDCK